ncbi:MULTISPECIES: hypothetical protein [Pseudomonadati]|uniref:Uncharacterized protein n=1 Tax=Shewanella aestuarii TaxID=1028752 RepID=A0ABT0L4I9_9GAMM|nr:hypothetical protein [Shewanella aestuarii]MCL1118644.1 hypothetical protein [Shewanella aestuarii]GGN83519.1 hypothetical protein GCM10009193_31830 [Shewanella aestuarii]
MSSKKNKRLEKYFKKATRQSKKRMLEIDINIDIPAEIDKSHNELAKSLLNFGKIIDESTKRISAFEANKYAQESISKIENSIIKLVNNHPKYYWKFYFTALPKEHFEGRLDTTFLFAIKMVESCISFSEKEIDETELYKNGNSVSLEINEYVVKDYCKLVGYSQLLGDMYTLIRISSKGCDFHICENELMPMPIDESAIIESIKLFDDRNVIESKVENGISMPSKSGFSLKQRHLNNIESLVIVANENQSGKYEYIPKKATKLKDTKYTKVNFNIVPISLETIYNEFKLGEEGLPWEIELLEMICILQFITTLIIRGWVFLPDIAEKGYLLFSKGFIDEYFQGFIESVKKIQLETLGTTFTNDATEIRNKYSRPLGENIYPSNISVFFDAGKMLGFDISSSFEFLFNKLEYTKEQGNIANLRGYFFEKQTQELIDNSKLKPASNIRSLVAKTLRFKNKSVTDFDAIMVFGNSLIAISCKSLLDNEEYDKGDYKTVRNITSSIEKYVEDWRTKIKLIDENKIGDNYDFSEFDEVIGLVVTPSVLYCNVTYRNELTFKGLYENMSSREFESWINITRDYGVNS